MGILHRIVGHQGLTVVRLKYYVVIDRERPTLYLCRQLSPILLFLSTTRHDMPIA